MNRLNLKHFYSRCDSRYKLVFRNFCCSSLIPGLRGVCYHHDMVKKDLRHARGHSGQRQRGPVRQKRRHRRSPTFGSSSTTSRTPPKLPHTTDLLPHHVLVARGRSPNFHGLRNEISRERLFWRRRRGNFGKEQKDGGRGRPEISGYHDKVSIEDFFSKHTIQKQWWWVRWGYRRWGEVGRFRRCEGCEDRSLNGSASPCRKIKR